MATYVVRVSDDEQGYADEWVFGTFRSRRTAEAFAARVNRHVQSSPSGPGPATEAERFG